MIQFRKHSGIFTLEAKQFINIPIEQAWDFFSSPANLSKITPSHMGFEITSELAEKMHAGQIITYRVGLLPGVKSNWVTEITHVDEQKFFVDEQRYGPYSMWHHEHRLTPIEGGTMMDDIISYKPPFGPLGSLANELFIKRQLHQIFAYRRMAIRKLFGDWKEPPTRLDKAS